MTGAAEAKRAAEPPLPRFVTGSTMRHVTVMTATGSVGLIAIFVVDLLSLLYISWLGDPRLTAAVGLATIVLFIATSIIVAAVLLSLIPWLLPLLNASEDTLAVAQRFLWITLPSNVFLALGMGLS